MISMQMLLVFIIKDLFGLSSHFFKTVNGDKKIAILHPCDQTLCFTMILIPIKVNLTKEPKASLTAIKNKAKFLFLQFLLLHKQVLSLYCKMCVIAFLIKLGFELEIAIGGNNH